MLGQRNVAYPMHLGSASGLPPATPAVDCGLDTTIHIHVSCVQSALFPLVPIARIAALQSEAALRAVPLPQAPGTLTLGVASSVMGAQVLIPMHAIACALVCYHHTHETASPQILLTGWKHMDPFLARHRKGFLAG